MLVLDVDGVLTDGRLPFDAQGSVAKTFYVQDGAALACWRQAGGALALISGRRSEATTRRAEELGAASVEQGVADKIAAFRNLCERQAVDPRACCFVGDDWPDLGPMNACGYPIAVANAIPAVKRAAAYVTRRAGGGGAVAEVVEHLMRRLGRWPPG